MKKLSTLLTLIMMITCLSSFAADHTISIAGITYSPLDLTVEPGDNITIEATTSHPTTEVSEVVWNANGTTDLLGGWGTETATFSFVAGADGTEYFYVCDNHVTQGMKGKITVMMTSSIKDDLNKIGFTFGPNPLFGQILSYSFTSNDYQDMRIAIVNPIGQVVHQSNIVARTGSIELPNTDSGLYIYVIRNRQAEILATGQIVVVE